MNLIVLILFVVLVGFLIYFGLKYMHVLDKKMQQPLPLVVMLILFIVFVLLFSLILDIAFGGQMPNWRRFLQIYGVFSQTKSLDSNDLPEHVSALMMLLSIIGAFLFTGLLISAVNNMLSQRIYKVRNGLVNYKFKEHVIIIGANSSLLTILKTIQGEAQLSKSKEKGRMPNILLVTSKEHKELSHVQNIVGQKLWDNVYYVKVDIKNPFINNVANTGSQNHFLDRLNIMECKEIFIIGDSSSDMCDIDNGGTLESIFNYLQGVEIRCRRSKNVDRNNGINCYVEYSNTLLYTKICRDLERFNAFSWHRPIKVFPFDFNMMLANRVWGAYNANYPELEPDKDGVCSIDIVGLNAMGIAMLKTALLVCHFKRDCSTKITVYVSEKDYEAKQLLSASIDFKSIKDISVEFLEVKSSVDYVHESKKAGTVVLCDNSTLINIQIAYAINKANTIQYIFIYSDTPFLKSLNTDNIGSKLSNIFPFGNKNQVIDIKRLQQDTEYLYTVSKLIKIKPNANINDYRDYKSKNIDIYYQYGFDTIKWRLVSIVLSFWKKIPPACDIILRQQIAAVALDGYTLRKESDFRHYIVKMSDLDAGKIYKLLEMSHLLDNERTKQA